MKTTTLYAEAIAILLVVAVVVHYLVGTDWPWAIVAGAAASVLFRAVLGHKPPVRHQPSNRSAR